MPHSITSTVTAVLVLFMTLLGFGPSATKASPVNSHPLEKRKGAKVSVSGGSSSSDDGDGNGKSSKKGGIIAAVVVILVCAVVVGCIIYFVRRKKKRAAAAAAEAQIQANKEAQMVGPA